MGMSLNQDTIVLSEKEFNDFKNEKYYINTYELNLISTNELKALFFDVINFLQKKKKIKSFVEQFNNQEEKDLFKYFLNNFEDIFDDYDEYIETEILLDTLECKGYISYNDWINYNDNNENYIQRDVVEHVDSNNEKFYILVQSRFW